MINRGKIRKAVGFQDIWQRPMPTSQWYHRGGLNKKVQDAGGPYGAEEGKGFPARTGGERGVALKKESRRRE